MYMHIYYNRKGADKDIVTNPKLRMLVRIHMYTQKGRRRNLNHVIEIQNWQ